MGVPKGWQSRIPGPLGCTGAPCLSPCGGRGGCIGGVPLVAVAYDLARGGVGDPSTCSYRGGGDLPPGQGAGLACRPHPAGGVETARASLAGCARDHGPQVLQGVTGAAGGRG